MSILDAAQPKEESDADRLGRRCSPQAIAPTSSIRPWMPDACQRDESCIAPEVAQRYALTHVPVTRERLIKRVVSETGASVQPSLSNPALTDLVALVGEWSVEIALPPDPSSVRGRVSFDWCRMSLFGAASCA